MKVKTKTKKEKTEKKTAAKEKPVKYFEAVGRRKTAIARVRLLTEGEKTFFVNNKNFENYFSTPELQSMAKSALEKMNCLDKFGISAKVKGGGLYGQAQALRLGISRALIMFNPDFGKRLKRLSYLTRDPRMKERKKFGLKRARKAPQWQKR
jgi:small subunit ribosomal protein S9